MCVYVCVYIYGIFVFFLSSMEESHEHQQVLIQQNDINVNLRSREHDLVGIQFHSASTHDRLHVKVEILKIHEMYDFNIKLSFFI